MFDYEFWCYWGPQAYFEALSPRATQGIRPTLYPSNGKLRLAIKQVFSLKYLTELLLHSAE